MQMMVIIIIISDVFLKMEPETGASSVFENLDRQDREAEKAAKDENEEGRETVGVAQGSTAEVGALLGRGSQVLVHDLVHAASLLHALKKKINRGCVKSFCEAFATFK